MNRRVLFAFVFLLNAIAWLATVELNNLLAGLHVHLHLEVLLIIFCAFYFGPVPGLVMASGFGFLVGATRPPEIGFTLLTFLGLWLAGIWMRRHLRRERAVHLAGFAAGAEFLLLLIYAVLLYPENGTAWGIYVQRVFFDGLSSAAAAALLAGPWCRFQLGLLASFGWDLEHEVVRK